MIVMLMFIRRIFPTHPFSQDHHIRSAQCIRFQEYDKNRQQRAKIGAGPHISVAEPSEASKLYTIVLQQRGTACLMSSHFDANRSKTFCKRVGLRRSLCFCTLFW